jgi:hypothetical protein
LFCLSFGLCFADVLDPDSYAASQGFAVAARGDGALGIVYPSVSIFRFAMLAENASPRFGPMLRQYPFRRATHAITGTATGSTWSKNSIWTVMALFSE